MKEDYKGLHVIIDKDDIPERDSYILLCKYVEDGNIFQFICNRNSWDFKQLYNDKYVRWFEYENIPAIMNIDNSDVTILETLYGVDNYERRHQKDILNPCKMKWLTKLSNAKEDNEIITNKVIKNRQKSIRQIINERYNCIRSHIISMNLDTVYECIKQIWFNERLMNELDKPRYKFMSNKKEMNDIGVVAIVFKYYLLDRKKSNKKLPFDSGKRIRSIILNVMRKEIKI